MNGAEMIPCDQVIARLWEYVDDELRPENAAAVRAHLEICSRCFPQYDFQRAYKEFVHRRARQPLPPALRRRVFEAILEEMAASPAPGAQGITGRARAFLKGLLRRRR